METLLVGEVLVTLLVLGGFGYFIYKRVTRKKDTTTTGSGGGGGGRGDGGNVNQV
jgi:hypothetical protein